MTRLVLVVMVAFASCLALDAISAPDDFFELQDRFSAAVLKGDAAAVRALSVESEATRVWEAVQSRQLDKAKSIYARHVAYSGASPLTGYYDLTARMVDGASVPFRVDLFNAGTDPRSGWKIQAIKYDQ